MSLRLCRIAVRKAFGFPSAVSTDSYQAVPGGARRSLGVASRYIYGRWSEMQSLSAQPGGKAAEKFLTCVKIRTNFEGWSAGGDVRGTQCRPEARSWSLTYGGLARRSSQTDRSGF